ncbi:hypothetical protein [Snuella sedimenti]|uniref:Lipocalin-like domain-containing protein n=1 Tax=Snuella sedimenti TaxID=2798802 RepID=A0A8J7J1E5_9FLAO|nr:hypothetical protein [Snuella sedimenti]MBJ6367169.1 hypothetical protein [Snuella sedimenti]
MKNLLIILMIMGVIFSCSNDDANKNVVNPELIGKWKLIETFEDPGDGSGVYESIESEKTIEFSNDGTFTINGPLCQLSTLVGGTFTGNVRNSNYSDNNILVPEEECDPDNPSAEYRVLIENSNLIIYYTACIEGCGNKYQKLNAE